MTATLDHIASAALPVAVGLLACAVTACAVLWTGFGDDQAQRTARRHLEPLCVWCLGALGVHVFARSGAGGSVLASFALTAALAAVALAVWHGGDRRPVERTPDPPPSPSDQAPGGDRPLWAGDAPDASTPKGLSTRG